MTPLAIFIGFIIGLFTIFIFVFPFFRGLLKRKMDGEFCIIRDNLMELLAEINKVTDSNITLLEERIETLKGCIKEADDRIEKLNQKPRRAQTRKKVEVLKSDRRQKEGESKDRSRIHELSSNGLSVKEIAKRVGVTQGEVSLILGLERIKGKE